MRKMMMRMTKMMMMLRVCEFSVNLYLLLATTPTSNSVELETVVPRIACVTHVPTWSIDLELCHISIISVHCMIYQINFMFLF
jgi:hypothetical protein